jgi:hypothetical protein
MAYILFGLPLGCALNHVLLALFPFDQLFDQLIIHNCSPIDKFSMICFGDHHGRFIAKILHLIFKINNGQNCNNSIDILLFHFLYNPPFIGVVSVRDSISYVYKCNYII